MHLRKLLIGLASVSTVALLAATAYAADTTEIVTGDTSAGENEPGWLFNRDQSTSTPYEFNTDAASIGNGSLYVPPISSNASDKFIAELFVLTPASDFSSISYAFLIAGAGDSSDANEFYLNIYTNLPGTPVDNFYQCRFDYTPGAGSTADFTTFSVEPGTVPTNVQSRGGASCPATLAELADGSTIRMLAISVGDTQAKDEGLAGYLDNVVVSVGGDTTTYDFEPALTPEDKNECKKGGWMTFNTPVFKNQGDCVSFVTSDGKAGGNKN